MVLPLPSSLIGAIILDILHDMNDMDHRLLEKDSTTEDQSTNSPCHQFTLPYRHP